jgi:hypothetical protein
MFNETLKELNQASTILQYRIKMKDYINNVDEMLMNRTKHLNIRHIIGHNSITLMNGY